MSCGSWIIEPGVPSFEENISVAGAVHMRKGFDGLSAQIR
jgi:hypothetical protein